MLGYRLDYRAARWSAATDTEHGLAADEALAELARGAGGLICEAMYTPAEYQGRGGLPKVGWVHSTWEAGVRVALRAAVKRLTLFHHEPVRSDEALEALLREAVAHHAETCLAGEGEAIGL